MGFRAARHYPDFVMLGIPTDDGVVLYASDKLWEANISMQQDQIPTSEGRYIAGPSSMSLDVTGGELRVVYAPTYAEAFRRLFADWAPAQKTQAGLPAPTAELEAP